MGYITGANRNQIILFPDSIDEYIDEGNPVRVIDAYIESLELFDLGFTKAPQKIRVGHHTARMIF